MPRVRTGDQGALRHLGWSDRDRAQGLLARPCQLTAGKRSARRLRPSRAAQLSKLFARIRGRGPKETLAEAGARLKEFFSSHSTLIVFERDAEPAEVAAGDLTFVEASKADAAGYERDIATDSAATFVARLGPGMHCFLAMDGSRIVHATWVTEIAAWTRELRSYLVPPEGHAYIYESYTSPAARGRGAYPFVLLSIVNWAAARGLVRLWVAVESENAASRRAVEKAGFRPAFEIAFRRSLGQLEIELPKPSSDRLELRKKFSRVGG